MFTAVNFYIIFALIILSTDIMSIYSRKNKTAIPIHRVSKLRFLSGAGDRT